jgi:hypothetical protein
MFRTIAEVRAAIAIFVTACDEHWLIGKNGYRAPAQTRSARIVAALPLAAGTSALCPGNRGRHISFSRC